MKSKVLNIFIFIFLVFSLIGYAGKTGPQCTQGEQGEPGTNGADGKSAYEIAVDNGYEGSESEWLNSLIGTPGISAYEVAVNNGYVTGVKYVGGIIGYSRLESSYSDTFKLFGDKFKNTKTIYGVDYVCGLIGYCYCDDSTAAVNYYSGGNAVITSGDSTNVHNVVIWDESFCASWDKIFGAL